MKVDLGQCAVCGAKNSKYVEKCYKCGAALPWAPDYVAPKNTPQNPKPANPATAPAVAPANANAGANSGAGAKTVVISPTDANSGSASNAQAEARADAAPIIEAGAASGAPTIKQRAQNKVQVPAWAMGAGGLGLLLLGMALWALLGKKPARAPVVVAPTPSAITTALAPIAPATTATPAMPGTTAQPTPATTAAPTSMPTTAPTSMPAAPVPNATAAPSAPSASPTSAPDAGIEVAPASGPAFDEFYANMTTGTPQQQALYWDAVKGKAISWRGEFVSLGNAAAGPLVVNCKNVKGALKVTIELDAAKPQTLPSFTANQSVPFVGVLASRGAGEVTVKNGRAN